MKIKFLTILITITLLFSNISSAEDCSQYSQWGTQAAKYNKCIKELKKQGKSPIKSKIKDSDNVKKIKDVSKKAFGKLNTDSKLTDWLKKQMKK
tara:strand:+ start:588 stop:869 length:282 start_codon:yes stop_codon:yes gene_type:complete